MAKHITKRSNSLEHIKSPCSLHHRFRWAKWIEWHLPLAAHVFSISSNKSWNNMHPHINSHTHKSCQTTEDSTEKDPALTPDKWVSIVSHAVTYAPPCVLHDLLLSRTIALHRRIIFILSHHAHTYDRWFLYEKKANEARWKSSPCPKRPR